MEKVTNYLTGNKVTLNGISLEKNLSGYHIIAQKDLAIGEVVAQIPKESVLSIRTTAIADILHEERIGGILGLTLAVAYESRLESSPWNVYLHAFTPPSLPFQWPEEAKKRFAGTDVGLSLEFDYNCIVEDYESITSLLKTLKMKLTLTDWINAHSIVSSRAFWVDSYHGESIVPLADLFNHSVNEDVHFESVDVCEECGYVNCLCGMEQGENEDDDEPPMLEDQQNGESDENPPELEDMENDDVDASILEMVTVRSVKKGDEVFNTYGQLSNSMLLRRYGFALDNNPHSNVHVEREDILSKVDMVVERVEYWDQVGKDILAQITVVEQEGDGSVAEDEFDEIQECNRNSNSEGTFCKEVPEEEWEDEDMLEGEDDDDAFIEDDFCFERAGPSYSLLVFTHILVMPAENFDQIATDLENAIQFFLNVKTEYTQQNGNNSDGKGKENTSSAKLVLRQVAQDRLKAYPEIITETSDDQKHKFALILQNDEICILNNYFSERE
jgi:hypothetical protein